RLGRYPLHALHSQVLGTREVVRRCIHGHVRRVSLCVKYHLPGTIPLLVYKRAGLGTSQGSQLPPLRISTCASVVEGRVDSLLSPCGPAVAAAITRRRSGQRREVASARVKLIARQGKIVCFPGRGM